MRRREQYLNGFHFMSIDGCDNGYCCSSLNERKQYYNGFHLMSINGSITDGAVLHLTSMVDGDTHIG